MSVLGKVQAASVDSITYPILLKWAVTGHIVLFTDIREGVVVVSASTSSPVGTYSNSLVAATSERWERLPEGTFVTLTNAPD